MKHISRFPFLIFSILIAIGVISFDVLGWQVLLGVWSSGTIACYFYSKQHLREFFIAFSFVLIGFLFHAEHIIHPVEELERVQNVVRAEQVRYKNKRIQFTSTFFLRGRRQRVLTTIPDTCSFVVLPGEFVLIQKKFRLPNHMRSPQSFDYKEFLSRKNIHWTSYCKCDEIKVLDTAKHSLNSLQISWNRSFLNRIDQVFGDESEAALVKGILVGYKEDISKEDKNKYGNAGIGHVFAVSGMHVGMVYLFCFPFLFLRNRNRALYFIIPIIVLAVVWLFIVLAGMTPSAVRAGIMITMYETAKILRRPVSKWNILGFAAFVSMVNCPLVVYDIGFQFSYLALIGIFILYRPIRSLIISKNIFISGFWTMTSLSISAQVVLLPLSMHYFETFSPFFWLNSLIAVLIVQLNFILSFICLIIPSGFYLLNYLVEVIIWSFSFLDKFIDMVMSWPFSILKWKPSEFEVITSYYIMSSLLILWQSSNKIRSGKRLLIVSSFGVLLSTGGHFIQKKDVLVVYQESKHDGVNILLNDIELRYNSNCGLTTWTFENYGIAILTGEMHKYSADVKVLIIDTKIDSTILNGMESLQKLILSQNVDYKSRMMIREFGEQKNIQVHSLYNGMVNIKL